MRTLTEAANLVMRITNDSIIPKLSPGDDINPVMFVLNHEGNISDIVSLNLPSYASERAKFGASVAKSLRAKGASGYVVLFMAWALRIDKGDPRFEGAELGDFPRPSQASDRIEVLTLTAGCSHTHFERVYRAIRDSDNRLAGFELLNDLSGDGFTQTKGLFVDMLGEV